MKNHLINVLFAIKVILLFTVASTYCQKVETKPITWENKLFEKSVDYGSYACPDTDKELINEFFKSNPIGRFNSVCHNNCAVLVEFPTRPLPYVKEIKGNGFIAIHVLVNEKGQPIFARTLNGHPLIRSIFQIRACEAVFRTSETKRHKVIFVCLDDKCEQPQPVL